MGAVILNDDALFYTIGGALRFAYAQQMQVICKTANYGVERGGKTGLTAHDAHAQAGMILAEVDLLPHIERHMVIAYYSFNDDERKVSIGEIVKWILQQQPTGIHNVRSYIEIIQIYCGRGQSVRGLANDMGVAKSTMHQWKMRVFKLLDAPLLRAKQTLESKLGNLLYV